MRFKAGDWVRLNPDYHHKNLEAYFGDYGVKQIYEIEDEGDGIRYVAFGPKMNRSYFSCGWLEYRFLPAEPPAPLKLEDYL